MIELITGLPFVKEIGIALVALLGVLGFGWNQKRKGKKEGRAEVIDAVEKEAEETRKRINEVATTDDPDAARAELRDFLNRQR